MTMKIRGSILGLVVIAAVLIALVLWYGKKPPVEVPPVASVETNAVPPATTAPSTPASAPVQSTTPMVQTTRGADLSKSPPPSKEARAIGLLSTYNDVPIDFYGRVEDQFSNAVDSAAVNFSVRVMNGQESTVNRGQVMTDGNGFFTIRGYRGQALGLMPEKAGYTLASTGTLFKYSRLEDQPYVPDANNPTVIKMWKLQGAEPLVSIDQHYKLPYTGSPVNVDLLAGKIVPSGGDIKVTVNRPAGVISGRNPQDWSLEIEAVNGGLIETSVGDARVTYAAPDSGYEPSETFTMSNGSNTWYEAVHQMFFVQSRNGQVYGKVNFSFRINQNPDDLVNITFSGVASTNGSHNWEATAPQP
jgi:hypothetical protein